MCHGFHKYHYEKLCIYLFFFRDSTQSREESLSVLRSSGDFLRYSVSVALQKIQQLEETGHTDGPEGQSPDKTFRHLCDITRSRLMLLSSVFHYTQGFSA